MADDNTPAPPGAGTNPEENRWTTEQVRVFLRLGSIRSAAKALHRMGIAPVAREPGKAGMNLYDAAAVQQKAADQHRRGRPANRHKTTS